MIVDTSMYIIVIKSFIIFSNINNSVVSNPCLAESIKFICLKKDLPSFKTLKTSEQLTKKKKEIWYFYNNTIIHYEIIYYLWLLLFVPIIKILI